MSVVEKNQFRAVTRGFVLSEPLNWPVFRDNLIKTTNPETPSLERIRETGMIAPLER